MTAELMFWADIHIDTEPSEWPGILKGPEKPWLCLRPSYFDFLLAHGHAPMAAIKQLMVDAQKVNGSL